MLTERQSRILELVIAEYVEGAAPVGSQLLSEKHAVGASPATIRNEMAELEAEGYLSHPHTSSGRVPTGKGYRFYVESLMREEQLPREAQQTIRHQFHQIERGQEAWAHLAVSVLAQSVRNAAVVTMPRTDACRVKHLELVSLHDRTALLVLVLDQGHLRQQVLELEEACAQGELSRASGRLNQRLAGLTASDVSALGDEELSTVERLAIDAVATIMQGVDDGRADEAYLDGLRHVLSQPEFSTSERALALLELLDERNLTRAIPLRTLARHGITVFIGGESPRLAAAGEAIQDCSVVVGAYGAPGVASGALAVLGPMRMRYSRTISMVRYLSDVMSELIIDYYE